MEREAQGGWISAENIILNNQIYIGRRGIILHNETKERWWERVDHIGYFTGPYRNDHPVPATEAGQLWLQDQQGDPGPDGPEVRAERSDPLFGV